jgi:hypothetical protein
MEVDHLPIGPTPHDRWICQELAAMKAPLTSRREPERVLHQFRHAMRYRHG